MVSAVIHSLAVDNDSYGETWTVGAGGGLVHVGVMYDNPDWNDDYELTPEVAEVIGRELIRAAQKAKPRKRYRMA